MKVFIVIHADHAAVVFAPFPFFAYKQQTGEFPARDVIYLTDDDGPNDELK